VVLHVALHLRVDAVGGAAQGQLTQGDQIALAEKLALAWAACSGT
jgi:hypothetical protein